MGSRRMSCALGARCQSRARQRSSAFCVCVALLALSLPAVTAFGQALPLDWASGGPDGGQITGLALWWGPVGLRLVTSTNGGGIFVSDNMGDTWWRAEGLTSFFITSVSVSPHASEVVYAGVEAREDYLPLEEWSKLVKSTDGGTTWFESSEGIQNSSAGRSIVMDVAVSTTSPDTVYAGCTGTPWPFHAPEFYRSVDGGATWQAAENGHNGTSLDVAVQPANGNVVLSATDYGVYRTTDGADSWTYVAFSATQVGVLQFYPRDPSIVLAGDATCIWRSTDAGLTWMPILQPGAPSCRVTCFAVDPGSRFVYAGTESQGVFVSMDQGATWSQLSVAAPLTSITELQIMPLGRFDHFYAGTSYRGIYRSQDAVNWEWSSERLAAATVRACEVLQDGFVLAGLQELGAARSLDGLWWTPSVGIGPLETVLCFAEDPRDGGGVYAGTDSGNVYVSFDRGYSWGLFHTFEGGGVKGLGVDRGFFGRFYAAVQEDSVYVTEDGGATWHGSYFGGGGYIGLEVNPRDGSRVLVPVHTVGNHGLYRSIDAGQTWDLKADLYPTNAAYDASDTSYAYCAGGLDWGIWRSTDGGGTWAILPGYPGGAGSSFVAVEPDEGAVWGAKGARGVYLSMDHGDSWLDTSSRALVNRASRAIAVGPYVEPRDVERVMVAVGVEGGGVWTNHDLPAGVPDDGDVSGSACAFVARPNPSSGTVELVLDRSARDVTGIRIYDITGRLVRTIAAGGATESVVWDGLSDDGREVACGVYLVEGMSAAGNRSIGKIVRLR
jgi:photosystem II stability/assembly factor-like uncharacterized protein